MVKFLLDHDVPAEIARILARDGHTVTQVSEVMPRTATDVTVCDYAGRHGLVLVSCNRDDFLGLAASGRHAGIIIVVRRRSRVAECAAVLRLLSKAGETGIAANINFA